VQHIPKKAELRIEHIQSIHKMGKKRHPVPTMNSPDSSKKRKQLSLADAFGGGGQAGKRTTIESARPPRPILGIGRTQELESLAEAYKKAWADRCSPSKNHMRGQQARASEDVSDLDAAGLRFLDSFNHVCQQAFREGAVFDRCVHALGCNI
jgi:hypothetical protein